MRACLLTIFCLFALSGCDGRGRYLPVVNDNGGVVSVFDTVKGDVWSTGTPAYGNDPAYPARLLRTGPRD